MNAPADFAPVSFPAPPCGAQFCDTDCSMEPCHRANRTHEAVHLLTLGARAGLIQKLTGLEIATTRRLYRSFHGQSAPGGQTPYSGYWYQENEQRLLQTGIVWHSYRHLDRIKRSAAERLIDVFEIYTQIVTEPLLDIHRVAFVPSLVSTRIWKQCTCAACGSRYIAPPERLLEICPACSIYYRYRCRVCGNPQAPAPTGRPRSHCNQCGTRGEKPRVYFLGKGRR